MPESDLPVIAPEDALDVAARTIYMADGLWFVAIEEMFGFETAFEINQKVWRKGGPVYAKRLIKHMNLEGKTPLEALAAVIIADPIMSVRKTHIVSLSEDKLVMRTLRCPPVEARLRDGKGVFNGIPGCTLLLQGYATAIDPKIKAKCIVCVPTPVKSEYWCEWEFAITDKEK